jgi:hypothetical protein
VKTDATGALEWTRTYGGPGDEVDCAVEQTSDGGYVVASRTNSFGAGSADVYIVKTDASGDLEWTRTYGGPGWEEGHSIVQTDDGGYLLTGYTESYGEGYQDIYMVRTDAQGALLWTRTIGGTGSERGHKVKQHPDGGFLIAAETNGAGAGGWDLLLVKMDAAGAVAWSKTYGGSGDDFGWDAQPVSDGGIVFVGYTNSFGAGGMDMYLMRLDTYGNELWSRTYGGPEDDIAYSVSPTDDGGFILFGETRSYGSGDADALAVKLSSDGSVTWSRTYGSGNADVCQYGTPTTDGGYVLSGYTKKADPDDWDFTLIKTDPLGQSGGCSETSPLIVPQYHSPNVMVQDLAEGSGGVMALAPTQVGSGGGAFPCMTVGVEEPADPGPGFVVYPNPVADEVRVSTTSGVAGPIKVFNAMGGEVTVPQRNAGATVHLDLGAMANGTYWITMDLQGQRVTRTLLKQ